MECQKKPGEVRAVILHNRAAVPVPVFGAVANLQLKVVFTLEHSQPEMSELFKQTVGRYWSVQDVQDAPIAP